MTKTRPEVQRLLIAYTVDLVNVLKELFYFTLKPSLALTATWEEVREAFEAYERSSSRQRAHNVIRSEFLQGGCILTADGFTERASALVEG